MRKKNTVTTCHFKSQKWHIFAWMFPYRSPLSAFMWFRKRHILCFLCCVWYLSKHSRSDASLSLSVPKDGFECCSQVPATQPNARALNENKLKKPGFCLPAQQNKEPVLKPATSCPHLLQTMPCTLCNRAAVFKQLLHSDRAASSKN